MIVISNSPNPIYMGVCEFEITICLISRFVKDPRVLAVILRMESQAILAAPANSLRAKRPRSSALNSCNSLHAKRPGVERVVVLFRHTKVVIRGCYSDMRKL